MIQYRYDGTFTGFLSCIFESFERKEDKVTLVNETFFSPNMFCGERIIFSDPSKARRVFEALKKKVGQDSAAHFYAVFASEQDQVIQASFELARIIFTTTPDILDNYGDSRALLFAKTLKMVNREAHRMKAFVRFSKSADGLYNAVIAPDFDVLPLVADFFKQRYADQEWIIYDQKRNYGLKFDKSSVSEITLSCDKRPTQDIKADQDEQKYQELWQTYFKSTNIKERRNIKLHLQHVPKRYWKYLVEKSS